MKRERRAMVLLLAGVLLVLPWPAAIRKKCWARTTSPPPR